MTTDRLALLLQSSQKLYHTDDLARIWNIANSNLLYTTVHRYLRKGALFRIRKGLYSVVPTKQLDPYLLGVSYLHRLTYVSTETVLAQAGVLAQAIDMITLVSDVSRRFSVAGHHYLVRRLRPLSLHVSAGIEETNGYLVASPERAAADLLYFNPRYYFDDPDRLDWKKIEAIQHEAGYK